MDAISTKIDESHKYIVLIDGDVACVVGFLGEVGCIY
jgi:hypothetical protein